MTEGPFSFQIPPRVGVERDLKIGSAISNGGVTGLTPRRVDLLDQSPTGSIAEQRES